MANELYHYGIPGMKWGVRRYRNEDGTLTEAGKRRYVVNKHDGSLIKKTSRLRNLESRYEAANRRGDTLRARKFKRRADRERARLVNTRPETLRQGDRLRKGITLMRGLMLAYALVSTDSLGSSKAGRAAANAGMYTYSKPRYSSASNNRYASTVNRRGTAYRPNYGTNSVPRIAQNPDHRTVSDVLWRYS